RGIERRRDGELGEPLVDGDRRGDGPQPGSRRERGLRVAVGEPVRVAVVGNVARSQSARRSVAPSGAQATGRAARRLTWFGYPPSADTTHTPGRPPAPAKAIRLPSGAQ